MGAEKAQMINLNLAIQGKPFEVVRSNTVNQKGLGCALGLLDAQRRGNPEMVSGAAREFRDFVEQQVGIVNPRTWRWGACGLYALLPNRPGRVRAECRTTSHCHLHYAWLGSGLWATRATPDRGNHNRTVEETLLRGALLDWLHQELSWSSICYVEEVGVLAPNRRHRRGKTHEIVLTSPDRDALYRFMGQRDASEQYHRQAMRPQNVQQLGYRTIVTLWQDADPGVRAVAGMIRQVQLQMPVFWDRLEVARRGNELVAWVVDMERKGRDDTSTVFQMNVWDAIDPDPSIAPIPTDWTGWSRTTFYAHDDKEVA